MNKRLYISLLFIGIFIFLGASSVNAQSNLVGKYFFDTKIDEGRHDFRYLFDLKQNNVAIYSNEQEGAETQKRIGTWNWNKKSNLVTVVLPPVKKNAIQGQEIKLTFVFKVVGNKLKLTKELPYNEGVGSIYQKL